VIYFFSKLDCSFGSSKSLEYLNKEFSFNEGFFFFFYHYYYTILFLFLFKVVLDIVLVNIILAFIVKELPQGGLKEVL
jgi:hypothetical protein